MLWAASASTTRHRSPSMAPVKKLKKTVRGRSLTSRKGKERAGGSPGPVPGSSAPPREVGPQFKSSSAAYPMPCLRLKIVVQAADSFRCYQCPKPFKQLKRS
ncbi:hypothetical protein UY3_12385 [Chelonia mydas]|uniref:Uncharacterized protein n=1 Tax=Chelonia mydas TaxID=8469 RepID=M7B4P4_CHEMY|nr:hypothetical protein UY3_12385 [Chelonia mydas]